MRSKARSGRGQGAEARVLGRLAVVMLLLFLLASFPASAMIQPWLLDWQARLSRLLPRNVQARAREVAANLPVTTTPPDLQAALELFPGVPEAAVELFAGIHLLQRKDRVLDRFDARVALLARSAEILEDYRRELNTRLRQARPGPPGKPPEPAGDLAREPMVDQAGVTVLRLLPRPTPDTSRERLRMLLETASADQAEVGDRLEKTESARQAFREATMVWRRHLSALSEGLDPSTGRPRAPGVPFLKHCPRPQVEPIPPPPPADLPPLLAPGEEAESATPGTGG